MPSFGTVIAIPILAQLVARSRVHRRHQLERVERLPAGVHLLEDDADGFLRGRLIERNHRNVVGLELLEHVLLERPELLADGVVLITPPKLVEAVLPGIPVEHVLHREHQFLVFLLGRREILHRLAPEILPDHLVFGNADNGVLAVDGRIERLTDVDVEPPLHLLVPRRHRLDHLYPQRHLVERGHALLAVEQQGLRTGPFGFRRRAFDRSRLEVHRPTGAERHQRAHREVARDGGD